MRFALAIATLALGSCSLMPGVPEAQEVPAHFGTEEEVARVHRVMILPFNAAPGVHGDTEPLREAFSVALAKTGRFELVPLPTGASEDRVLYQSLNRGRLSTEALAALGKRYYLDGVLLGTVTGYRPYKPPHLGMRVQLISMHTATAVWATEAFYDSNDAGTAEDIQHYMQSYQSEEESMHGWEITLISPRRFAAFVAHRLVGTWREPRFASPD